MGLFDRKIYFYFQHSHALTLSRSHFFPAAPRVPVSGRLFPAASSFSPAPLFRRSHPLTPHFLPNSVDLLVTQKVTHQIQRTAQDK